MEEIVIAKRKGSGIGFLILSILLLIPGVMLAPLISPLFGFSVQAASDMSNASGWQQLFIAVTGFGAFLTFMIALLILCLLISGIGALYTAIALFATPRDVILVNDGEMILKLAFGRKKTLPFTEIESIKAKRVRIMRQRFWLPSRLSRHGLLLIKLKTSKKQIKSAAVHDVEQVADQLRARAGMRTGNIQPFPRH